MLSCRCVLASGEPLDESLGPLNNTEYRSGIHPWLLFVIAPTGNVMQAVDVTDTAAHVEVTYCPGYNDRGSSLLTQPTNSDFTGPALGCYGPVAFLRVEMAWSDGVDRRTFHRIGTRYDCA
jgi:hypothetical protein